MAKAEGELPSQVFVPPTPIRRGFLCYSLQLYLIVHSIFHIFAFFFYELIPIFSVLPSPHQPARNLFQEKQ